MWVDKLVETTLILIFVPVWETINTLTLLHLSWHEQVLKYLKK